MSALDEAWARVVDDLPIEVRDAATGLPYRLGLTYRPDGGWGDFTRLPAMYDLPFFVVDALNDVDPSRLSSARFAHCCAGFHGLLIDRLADGQSAGGSELARLRVALRHAWARAVAAVTGDPATSRVLVDRAERAWRAGVRLERAALSERRLTPQEYARIVSLKVRWLAVASIALLDPCCDDATSTGFRRAFELLMLSMQAMDDALDEREDLAVRGCSIPSILGFEAPALLRSAYFLAIHASRAAASAGLHQLAGWCAQRAETLFEQRLGGAPVLNELGGLALSSLLVEVVPRRPRWLALDDSRRSARSVVADPRSEWTPAR